MIDFEEDILSPQSNVSNSNSEEELWVCRYRPRTLEHFCLDEKLKNIYGDYMQLPPVEKRKNHYPYCLQLPETVSEEPDNENNHEKAVR